ncbi:MAG: hypothetical protein RL260_1717 [Pseudomonadota bacterium]
MKTDAPMYLALHEALRRLGTPGPLAVPDLHDYIEDYLHEMCALHLPHGSGFDEGVHLQISKYTADREMGRDTERLVFVLAFHHMNDAGYHTGWTHHSVWVTPVFGGIKLRCGGPDRDGTKEYILELMYGCLTEEVPTFEGWAYDQGRFNTKEKT